MVNVVAALIVKDDKILIAKRLEGHHQGLWEFPGGKIEPGETPETALIREMKEELDIDIKVDKYLSEVTYKYPHIEIYLKLYQVSHIKGNIKLCDHKEIKWINQKDVFNYELTKADAILANQIFN